MRDYFFQIFLFLLGAVIAVGTQRMPDEPLKTIARMLSAALVCVSLLWFGYEWGASNQPNINKAEPPTVINVTPNTAVAMVGDNNSPITTPAIQDASILTPEPTAIKEASSTSTLIAIFTPIPTDTQLPTSTPIPTNTSTPIPPTDTPTETPSPTNTSTATDTPTSTATPTLTPISTTEPGTILENGEAWHVEGWSLTVSNFNYNSLDKIRFVLQNRTDRLVVFPAIDGSKFSISSDVAGDRILSGCYAPTNSYNRPAPLLIEQTDIPVGGKIEWEWHFLFPEECWNHSDAMGWPRYSSNTKVLTLAIENVGDIIRDARWKTELPRP